jgi:ribosomal protein S25
MAVSQREVSEALEKLNEADKTMFSGYEISAIIGLGYDESVIMIDYMVGHGVIEKIIHNNNEFYVFKKAGLKFIEESKKRLKERARESDKVETVSEVVRLRLERVYNFIKQHGKVTVNNIRDGVGITYNQSYSSLTTLEELGKIKSVKEGHSRFFFIEGEVNEDVKEQIKPTVLVEPQNIAETIEPGRENQDFQGLSPKIGKIIKVLINLPGDAWSELHGKKNNGKDEGYLKVKIQGVDNCIGCYRKLRDEVDCNPRIDLNSKNDGGKISIKLPTDEGA